MLMLIINPCSHCFMEILCTRPGCTRPQNHFADLDDPNTLKTTQQKYCTSCGMPLILAGRYLPSKLLGQGGFGAAYLARDRYTTSLRQCVVKLFQPSGDLSPQALQTAQELFQREAEVLEKLGNEHKQIPNSYAFFPLVVPGGGNTEEQFFYLVQEFIDGEDLEQELERKGQFSQAEVLEVLAEILKVLQFVHENGSIHRDIKPSNIMRSRQGRLYLLDFGAVKQVTAAGGKSGRSTGIYSMGFAPPEQMQGSQVFPSTDLYALAVTCLTLFTGKDARELYDSYENQWKWRSYTPNINARLADIFDKMLRPSPSQRFQSAQEILDIFTGKSTPTPQPSNPPVSQSPNPPVPQSPNPPAPQPSSPATLQSRFTLTETLANAAFVGFEGALIFIVLGSLLPSPALSIGLFGATMGGLLYALYRRLLEGNDIPIFAAVSFVLVVVIPFFRDMGIANVVIFAILAAAGVVAVTAFFQLVYKLISRFF
jgi:serine/threonine protein kinase